MDSSYEGSIIKILFLAANPTDTARLRVGEESSSIDQALLQTKYRDRFELEQAHAVRVADMQGLLLRYQPHIVHFSGHGGEASGTTNSATSRHLGTIPSNSHGSLTSAIILEDDNGNSHPVSTRALSRVFSVLKNNIRCVVLNACYSEEQAKAIAEHIDCVIGMSAAISDKAAISFATAFYRALGYGTDVKTAFESGCAQIGLENIPEEQTPQLLATKVDPAQVVLVSPELEGQGTVMAYLISLLQTTKSDMRALGAQARTFLSSLRTLWMNIRHSWLTYALGATAIGLVSFWVGFYASTSLKPSGSPDVNHLITYHDFEGAEDHGWSVGEAVEIIETGDGRFIRRAIPTPMHSERTTDYALTGQRSLKVATAVNAAGTYQSYLYWDGAAPNGYGATIYMLAPEFTDGSIDYVQLCIRLSSWACSSATELALGEWTPLIINLKQPDSDGKSLSSQILGKLAIQWRFNTKAPTSLDVYFDSVEFFSSGTDTSPFLR
jgi:hypothetical protein